MRVTPDEPEEEEDVPQTVGVAMQRCPDCDQLHIAMFDDEDNVITEMSLSDQEALRLALQLLLAVFPTMNAHPLIERINEAAQSRH